MYSSYHLCPLKKKKIVHMMIICNPMVCTSCNQFYFGVIMEDSPKDALTESITSQLFYLLSYIVLGATWGLFIFTE